MGCLIGGGTWLIEVYVIEKFRSNVFSWGGGTDDGVCVMKVCVAEAFSCFSIGSWVGRDGISVVKVRFDRFKLGLARTLTTSFALSL